MHILGKITVGSALAVLASLGFSASAFAGSNLIQNSDFSNVSDPVSSFNGYTVYSTAADWTVGNDVVFSGAETNGQTAAIFNGGDATAGNDLSQTFATTIGRTYDVSFAYGAYGAPTGQTLNASINGTDLDTISTVGNGSVGAVLSPYTFSFVASSNATTLKFDDIGSSTLSVDGDLSDVVVKAVPEASTVALFSVLLGCGFLLLRNRKQTSL